MITERDNFMIEMSGPHHTIDRTVSLTGGGTIHELTAIEIASTGGSE